MSLNDSVISGLNKNKMAEIEKYLDNWTFEPKSGYYRGQEGCRIYKLCSLKKKIPMLSEKQAHLQELFLHLLQK